jgi:CBS-domain-containing membrane protein
MERLYICTGAFAVIGASLGGPATRSLIAGDRSIPILLMAIGGVGMIVTAVYESLRTDPEEFTISAITLFALVGAACMAVLGTILSAISGV